MIVFATANAWNLSAGSSHMIQALLLKWPCGAGGRIVTLYASESPARRSANVQVTSYPETPCDSVSRQSAPLAPASAEPDGKLARLDTLVASDSDTFATV